MRSKELNKPIFIVGHARGGTTLLGAIINAHSMVGPKYFVNNELNSNSLKDYKKHLEFSERLEQKDIWFKYFKGNDCFTHMGKEIYERELNLSEDDIAGFKKELFNNFNEERFLSKAPTNVFRVEIIRKLFPNSKILVILRRGEHVVSSWGKRPYGFGKEVNWGKTKIERLGFFKGINIFTRKWKEVIEMTKKYENCDQIEILTYENLIENTEETLKNVFHFLELPFEKYLSEINLNYNFKKWKKDIPLVYRFYLKLSVYRGNKEIKKMTKK